MVPRRQDLAEVRGAEMIGKIQISGPSAEQCENAADISELERLDNEPPLATDQNCWQWSRDGKTWETLKSIEQLKPEANQ